MDKIEQLREELLSSGERRAREMYERLTKMEQSIARLDERTIHK
jgi:hypothetical protein